MEKGWSSMQMVIFIKENLLMGWLKVSGSIHGAMGLFIKEISSKDIEMDMESGNQTKANNNIKAIICLIKNMDMGSMIGEMGEYTKGIMCKTQGQGRDNSTMDNSFFTVAYGKMDEKWNPSLLKNVHLMAKKL